MIWLTCKLRLSFPAAVFLAFVTTVVYVGISTSIDNLPSLHAAVTLCFQITISFSFGPVFLPLLCCSSELVEYRDFVSWTANRPRPASKRFLCHW